MLKKTILSLIALIMTAAPALAQEAAGSEDGAYEKTITADDLKGLGEAFEAAGDPFLIATLTVVQEVIAERFSSLDRVAGWHAEAVTTLCTSSEPAALADAQQMFVLLRGAYARADMFNYGPARTEDRFARLYFWPDVRGRGMKRVRQLLDREAPEAATLAALRGQRVAARGLMAQDFLLNGEGAEADLLQPGSFRCLYAQNVSTLMQEVTGELHAQWCGGTPGPDCDGPYTQLLITAGPDNPVYQTRAETLEKQFRALRTYIDITQANCIDPLIRPKHGRIIASQVRCAPFSPGDIERGLIAGVDIMIRLQDLKAEAIAEGLAGRFAEMADTQPYIEHIYAALEAMATLGEPRRPIRDRLDDPQLVPVFTQVQAHLAAARAELADVIVPSLGMSLGFNALDGD